MLPSDPQRRDECPVTPQDLYGYAEDIELGLSLAFIADKIYKLADWLEQSPEQSAAQREPCSRCGHTAHAMKCLQALRVGKPGEDRFCLCKQSAAPSERQGY